MNPGRRDAIDRLSMAKEQGALFIKWLPSIQHFDPADRRLLAYYRYLADLQLPPLTRPGDERAFSHADNRYGDPLRLTLALEAGVTVIAAHAAVGGNQDGAGNLQRLLRLIDRPPNLCADISSLTQLILTEVSARAPARRRTAATTALRQQFSADQYRTVCTLAARGQSVGADRTEDSQA